MRADHSRNHDVNPENEVLKKHHKEIRGSNSVFGIVQDS